MAYRPYIRLFGAGHQTDVNVVRTWSSGGLVGPRGPVGDVTPALAGLRDEAIASAVASEASADDSEIAATESEAARDASRLALDQATQIKADVLAQGEVYGSYTTLAAATAAIASIPEARAFTVTADGENSGFYVKRSGVLVRDSTATISTLNSRQSLVETAIQPGYESILDGAPKLFQWTAKDANGNDREVGYARASDAGLVWANAEFTDLVKTPKVLVGDTEIYSYATLEPGDIFVVDADGRIISSYPQESSGGAQAFTVENYSSLETEGERFIIVDAMGQILGIVPSKDLDQFAVEVQEARGNAVSLSARLAVTTDADGQEKKPHAGMFRLRQTRMKIGAIRGLIGGQTNVLTAGTQLCINLLGDSYTYNSSHVEPLTRSLRTLLGNAGGGFVNFRTPYNRPHCVVGEVSTIFTGTWADTAGNLPTPDLGCATSSTPGDKVVIAGPAAPAISAATLHYVPTADGSAQYRWNGGAWASLDLTVGTGSGQIALTGLPGSGTWSLEIAVVSGSCRLSGVDVRGSATGVRVNKLGQNGAAALQWASQSASDAWTAAQASLSPDLFVLMLSANDQPTRTPVQIAANLLSIAQRCKAAVPAADVLIAQQPENQLGRATSMASITKAVRAMAVTNNIAFLDHQYLFGDAASDYGAGSPHDWMPDLIHPDALRGGPAMADAFYRAITNGF